MWILAAAMLILLAAAGTFLFRELRRRGLHRCLWSYVREAPRRRQPPRGRDVHVLLCFADHFEPKRRGADPATAWRRVQRWVEDYPRQFRPFGDSDGRTPRHSFFFPAEEYQPEYLDALAELCRGGFGEVEIHLHHDRDTAANLRHTLNTFKELLAARHGLLARHRTSGTLAYGFIHGNWVLCNSRHDGRYCGVNEEIDVLRATGCYADFTFPSAPDSNQPAIINSIYYARNLPGRPRSHDCGVRAGRGVPPADSLLLIQGPLVLDWRHRKRGIFPRLENGCLQRSQPPHIARLDAWLRASVRLPTRPDWYFVKLHLHGAQDGDLETMLGEPMVQFHRDLARRARDDAHFHFHYVTAREMYNLVKAAEAGWQGAVRDALDFELVWNGGRPIAFDGAAAHAAQRINIASP